MACGYFGHVWDMKLPERVEFAHEDQWYGLDSTKVLFYSRYLLGFLNWAMLTAHTEDRRGFSRSGYRQYDQITPTLKEWSTQYYEARHAIEQVIMFRTSLITL